MYLAVFCVRSSSLPLFPFPAPSNCTVGRETVRRRRPCSQQILLPPLQLSPTRLDSTIGRIIARSTCALYRSISSARLRHDHALVPSARSARSYLPTAHDQTLDATCIDSTLLWATLAPLDTWSDIAFCRLNLSIHLCTV